MSTDMPTRVLAVFGLLVVPQFCLAQSNFHFHQPVEPPRTMQVVAQRGLRMLAPENSVEAVRECAVDFIEWAAVDVRRTQDGHNVVLHEDSLPADGPRTIDSLTLEKIRLLPLGERFANRFKSVHPVTVAELFSAVGHDVNLVLNCEGVDAATLIGEIHAAGLEPHVVVSGPEEFLQKVRDAGGANIARMATLPAGGTPLSQLIENVEPAVIQVAADDVTAERCRELHARGIRVFATALGVHQDTAGVWARLIEAGVDAILTDNPAGVRFTDVRKRIPKFPVQIALHRGANRYAPENTLPAIELAAALQADYIEIDIQTTQDGQFVLVHDRSLDRTTNGSGPVIEQTAAAIAMLDAGGWFGAPFAALRVLPLDDGLTALGPRSHAYLDAKNIAPEALVAAIRQHDLISRHVVYQSPDYCRRLKLLEPNVRLLPPLRRLDDLEQLTELRPYGVDAAWKSLSQEMIARCHEADIQVFSDAIGDHETVEDYRRAIGWGIDVIQTDYPLRVLRAIELEAPPAK